MIVLREGKCENIMYKAYMFRLYPNKKQEEIINKTVGCTRFIYNHFLEDKKIEYEQSKKSKTAFEQIKTLPTLTKKYPFLKEVDSCSLRNSTLALDDAFKKFYKGAGYPNYKKKDIHNSYKTNNIKSEYKGNKYESIKLDLENKLITLPKLKQVKIRGYRNKTKIIGDVKSAVIRKDAGKYYVSVLVEEDIIKPLFTPNNIVGIDLGIKDLIITSNYEKIENSIDMQKYKRKLIGLQRALARAKSGSKNRYKLKLKIQKVYKKIRNARKHLIHNIINNLVKENDIIITENLDIKNMYQNHNIAKSLTNAPLGEIIRVLKYKTEWQNKKLIQIDRYCKSSQECSRCGYINKEVKNLSIRKWECKECKTFHDRDYNASENILFEGIKKYMVCLNEQ